MPVDKKRPIVRCRRAFTLVEVLGAVALAGFLASAAGYIVVQSACTQVAMQTAMKLRWGQEQVLDQFACDVESELTWLSEGAPTVTLPDDRSVLLEIVGLAEFAHGSSAFVRRLPAKIRYQMKSSAEEHGSFVMVREARFLHAVPPPVESREVTRGLKEARVDFFVDGRWCKNELGPEERRRRPQAVRLECVWNESGRAASKVVILRNLQRVGARRGV